MLAGWRDAGRDGPHPKIRPGRVPLAANSIGRGRKYFSAAICSMFDGTQITARDKGISAFTIVWVEVWDFQYICFCN